MVLDKEGASSRGAIFMIDASKGFMKDGPKNRLRAQDIHKIVDAFSKQLEIPNYSRMVYVEEIEKNEFNLNLPRYIDNQKAEDLQDIEGHLKGGIPLADVESLQGYWEICPSLRSTLFRSNRPGYVEIAVEKSSIKSTIYDHPQFKAFIKKMNARFSSWKEKSTKLLKAMQPGCHPKEVITKLSEDLLAHYANSPLGNPYNIYQHLMDYWAETMQDDCYLISADGWRADTYRIIETDKQGKKKDKGWACDLVPRHLIIGHYFAQEQAEIDRLAADLESVSSVLAELEEEHNGEDGALTALDKINRAHVSTRLKEIKNDKEYEDEADVLNNWIRLSDKEADLKKRIKDLWAHLDRKALAKYPKLTEQELKSLVIEGKWLSAVDAAVHSELDRISQQLAGRIKELAERYATPLRELTVEVEVLAARVTEHLRKMSAPCG